MFKIRKAIINYFNDKRMELVLLEFGDVPYKLNEKQRVRRDMYSKLMDICMWSPIDKLKYAYKLRRVTNNTQKLLEKINKELDK